MSVPDNLSALLRAAMDAQGVTDDATRAGIAAIAMGESGMMGYVEEGYAHTSNERIREVFGARVPADDDELDALKASDEAFFEAVYGATTRVGQQLGNTQPGDGYRFRGRYAIQITGRGNYTRYANKAGHLEILGNPDLGIADPAIGMALSVAYIKDRYKGGGFDAMLAAVGNNTPDIEATKRSYYAQFLASGEFAQAAPTPSQSSPNAPTPSFVPGAMPTLQRSATGSAVTILQRALVKAGYPTAIDGDFGRDTRRVVIIFQMAKGLTPDGVVGPQTWTALAAS